MMLFSMSRAHDRIAFEEILNAAESIERNKLHRHELWLLSCYIEPEVARQLIAELDGRIRLTDVYLAFDMSEFYRIGPRKAKKAMGGLQSSCTQRGINFEWRVLAANGKDGLHGLVHSKGYALVQRIDGKISSGALLIGSANLTRPGLKEGSNIELGCLTTKLGDLRGFEKTFNELWENFSRSTDHAVLKENNALFRFALLTNGKFLHKWSGSLRQLVGIKYQVVNKDKWAQLPKELADEGFELSDTLTRQPLMLKELPKKEVTGDFTRNFTVDTSIGRWCPKEVWQHVAERDTGPFVEAFMACTTADKLAEIVAAADIRQKDLIQQDLIRPVDADHLARWVDRINALRENPDRLHRLHTGYEDFELPFDAQRTADISDLFDSLEDSLRIRSSDNWTTRKLHACIQQRNLDELAVDDEALELLEKCVKPSVQTEVKQTGDGQFGDSQV